MVRDDNRIIGKQAFVVTQGIASAMKDLGFDWPCDRAYRTVGGNTELVYRPSGLEGEGNRELDARYNCIDGSARFCAAPTLEEAAEWLWRTFGVAVETNIETYMTSPEDGSIIPEFRYEVWEFFRHMREDGSTDPRWDDRVVDSGDGFADRPTAMAEGVRSACNAILEEGRQ